MPLHLPEAPHHEVICFDGEEDNTEPLPWSALFIETEENHELTLVKIQVIELEVERPRTVLPFGISCIYDFSFFCSQESAESFSTLDSFKFVESFISFFFPFFKNIKKLKFDFSDTL